MGEHIRGYEGLKHQSKKRFINQTTQLTRTERTSVKSPKESRTQQLKWFVSSRLKEVGGLKYA